MKGLDRILDLQEVDSAIDRLESGLRELEQGAVLDEGRREAEQAEEAVGELRLALDSIVREQERFENEADSIGRKMADEQARLYDGSVANPKELESIQREVANLRERKSRIEDDALGQMERREEIEERLPTLDERLAAARRRVEELEAASAEELDRLKRELEERRAVRGALVPEFDEELLELYGDLRAQKQGLGAARLVDGVCGGCHQKLSALELDRLKKTDGLRRCEYCRRILVLD
ncbi:MAG: zinc ribbon domain-containing protein [Actinomycetota bacterium]